MIIRARAVVTMAGEPIANGAVAIAGNRIVDVGSWPQVRARNAGVVTDLGERALLPGLVNAHCHFDYTNLRGAIARPSSFAGWIREINACKAALGPADYVRSIRAGAAEAAKFGTTTVANLEAFPELIGEVGELPLRTWWFAEMIDVRTGVSAGEVLDGLEKTRRGLGGVGLAPHAPFTASQELYAGTAALARARNIPATTHLAEAAEEMAMFKTGNGALFDFLQEIGRPMADCGRGTPLAWLAESGVLEARWIVAHLNELTGSDLGLLARGPRFQVVHCPRSHRYFGHSPFQLKELRGLGFKVCLGTDSLASNDDLSLFAEMRQLWETYPTLTAFQILEMATVNGAAALGMEEALGRLAGGFFADIIAVPCTGALKEVEAEIVSFTDQVPWRMLDGIAAAAG